MTDATVTVYDPTASSRTVALGLAPRPAALIGATIGILDNGKANAGLLMTRVVDSLKHRCGVADVVVRRKPVAGPAAPHVLAELEEQCAAVLVGSAD